MCQIGLYFIFFIFFACFCFLCLSVPAEELRWMPVRNMGQPKPEVRWRRKPDGVSRYRGGPLTAQATYQADAYTHDLTRLVRNQSGTWGRSALPRLHECGLEYFTEAVKRVWTLSYKQPHNKKPLPPHSTHIKPYLQHPRPLIQY